MTDLEVLMRRYEGNRVIRGLIQLVPYGLGSAIDVVIMQTYANMKKERMSKFFDELSKDNVVVDEALLESHDFLHCYLLTIQLALNTRREEKIRMFARYLKNSLHQPRPSSIDEYEDYLQILDDLSYREMQALSMLDEFSDRPREPDNNDLNWTESFWNEFEEKMVEQLSIPRTELASFMNRIARTGCYEMYTGSYWDYTGGKGKLTPMYARLVEYVRERGAKFPSKETSSHDARATNIPNENS